MRISENAVREMLREHINRPGHSAKCWAMDNGFGLDFVRRVLRGKAAPTSRMCEALGVRKAVEYTLLVEPVE